jgi:hypothetical protein
MKLLQWYAGFVEGYSQFHPQLWNGFEAHTSQYQLDNRDRDPARFDRSRRLWYVPYCSGQPNGIPAFGTACAAANQFAVDPRIANPLGPTC